MSKVKSTISKSQLRDFTRGEEIIHAATHGFGAVLGIVALIFLCIKTLESGSHLFPSIMFGVSIIMLYSASAFFHTTCAIFRPECESRVREVAKVCDHAMINLLIVGTYAPASINGIGGTLGYVIFGVVATLCTAATVLILVDIERFRKLNFVLYFLAGWAIAVAIYPFYKSVGIGGILLLVLGGIAYTVGAFFYKLDRIKYMHVLWHLFVILGTVLHYLLVYFYCI